MNTVPLDNRVVGNVVTSQIRGNRCDVSDVDWSDIRASDQLEPLLAAFARHVRDHAAITRVHGDQRNVRQTAP